MPTPRLKAPFVWFGGKSKVASLVWHRLGAVSNFLEPFAGSLAVLLRRPHPWVGVETVNDLDCMVANMWRATQHDPEGVVDHCNWPVNEVDLHSRHRWLVLSEDAAKFRERMRTDPDHFDAKVAGWWVWGINQWIGGGWCAHNDGPGRRPRIANDGSRNGGGVDALAALPAEFQRHMNQPPSLHPGNGVNISGPPRRRPAIAGDNPGSVGKGVHSAGDATLSQQLPCMDSGRGMDAAPGAAAPREGRPQLADAFDVGRGVHSHGDLGTCAERRAWLLDWFGRLRDRLRLVRVCCGQWHRICDSPSVTTRLGVTGIFLDAPYRVKLKDGTHNRDAGLYAVDEDPDKVVDEVIAYCLERGADPMYRIAACGYEGEGYEILQEAGWECVAWKTQGGYSNQGKSKKVKGKANNNAARERLYFSPHCNRERTLFDNIGPGSLDLPEADEE